MLLHSCPHHREVTPRTEAIRRIIHIFLPLYINYLSYILIGIGYARDMLPEKLEKTATHKEAQRTNSDDKDIEIAPRIAV